MILDRIKKYIDLKGITISAFEKSIGMSNASFGKSLKNGGAIGTDKLENILNIYQDISPEWLLTGKGAMLKTGFQESDTLDRHAIPYIDFQDIPCVGANTIARDMIRKYYIVEEFDYMGAVFMTSCIDLNPKYPPGSLLACKKVNPEQIVQSKDYVIDLEGIPIILTITSSSNESISYVSLSGKDKGCLDRPRIRNAYLIIGCIIIY